MGFTCPCAGNGRTSTVGMLILKYKVGFEYLTIGLQIYMVSTSLVWLVYKSNSKKKIIEYKSILKIKNN